jgi:hypothetical protein
MKRSCYYFLPIYTTDMQSFVEKYPKIKSAISDRPHNLVMDLCEGSNNYWMDRIETWTFSLTSKLDLRKNCFYVSLHLISLLFMPISTSEHVFTALGSQPYPLLLHCRPKPKSDVVDLCRLFPLYTASWDCRAKKLIHAVNRLESIRVSAKEGRRICHQKKDLINIQAIYQWQWTIDFCHFFTNSIIRTKNSQSEMHLHCNTYYPYAYL